MPLPIGPTESIGVPLKSLLSMYSTVPGTVSFFNSEQFSNAPNCQKLCPIPIKETTVSGIFTFVSEEQFAKVAARLVTPSGITTSVSNLQPMNVPFNSFTPEGIWICPSDLHP